MCKTIVISAGHSLSDPGATTKGSDGTIIKESELTMDLRDKLAHALRAAGWRVLTPSDAYSVRQTINYINNFPSNEPIPVVDIHYNAFNGEAHGVEVFTNSGKLMNVAGKAMVGAISETLGLTNRGVKQDKKSKRGRLGLLREVKNSMILEVCFMDNPEDLEKVSGDNQQTLIRVLVDTIEATLGEHFRELDKG